MGRAASFVLAGVIEREIDHLAEFEMQCAEMRAHLRSAQLLWFAGAAVPISPVQAKVLNEPPPEVIEGIGQRMANVEARQEAFTALYSRLCSGEIDGELENTGDDG